MYLRIWIIDKHRKLINIKKWKCCQKKLIFRSRFFFASKSRWSDKLDQYSMYFLFILFSAPLLKKKSVDLVLKRYNCYVFRLYTLVLNFCRYKIFVVSKSVTFETFLKIMESVAGMMPIVFSTMITLKSVLSKVSLLKFSENAQKVWIWHQ